MTAVIVLNGASSAGKSTLARALQDVLPDDWLTFGVDTLITAMPLRLDGSPEGLLIHPGGKVEVGPRWRALEAQWRVGLAAMARSGLRIVLDEVILDGAAGQRAWNAALAGVSVLWVGVQCDLGVLAAREAARGDRAVGMAAKQAAYVHEGLVYDLEVDTSARSARACAEIILSHISEHP